MNRYYAGRYQKINPQAGGCQFGAGRETLSITIASTVALVDCNFKPSCSSTAVKIEDSAPVSCAALSCCCCVGAGRARGPIPAFNGGRISGIQLRFTVKLPLNLVLSITARSI